jgi:hypothetical protein
MSTGLHRPWWSPLCSIYFVVSIVLPTTAPFQVVGFGEALRFASHPGVARPSRVAPSHAVANETCIPSCRGQEDRLRYRPRPVAMCRRTSTVDRPLCATLFKRNLPDLSRPIEQQLTVLRI